MADEAEEQGRDYPVRRDEQHLNWVVPNDGLRYCCLCGVPIPLEYVLVRYPGNNEQSHAACSETCAVALELGARAHQICWVAHP